MIAVPSLEALLVVLISLARAVATSGDIVGTLAPLGNAARTGSVGIDPFPVTIAFALRLARVAIGRRVSARH